MEPIKGMGGKRWAKMLHYICLSRAQKLSGRAPHAQIHTGIAAQLYTCAGASSSELGLCAGNGVNH